jgi:hypothetical protein
VEEKFSLFFRVLDQPIGLKTNKLASLCIIACAILIFIVGRHIGFNHFLRLYVTVLSNHSAQMQLLNPGLMCLAI